MLKKKTRRSEAKYPALDPHLNLKTRFEQIDFDYVDQLPTEWIDPVTGKKYNPKQYLNDFASEYIHADFSINKKRVHKTKRIQKKRRVEHEKNKDLNILRKNLLESIKGLNELINNSIVNNTTKIKLKKLVVKLKVNVKKLMKSELAFVNDYYQKEAYDRNNARNRCVLTRARAQGKALGFDDLPEDIYKDGNVEDELIEQIDQLKLAQESEDTKDEG